MTPALGLLLTRTADPPVTPSPDEARSWVGRELLRPEYHDQNWLQRLLAWLQRTLDSWVTTASNAPLLATLAAMAIGLALVVGLALLLSRARRQRTAAGEPGAGPLGVDSLTARELRQRARQALADGRPGDAVLDGFRALAVRQVERQRLDDAPGATADEVARALGSTYPERRAALDDSARLFDLVLYGGRPATADQATGVLALDEELDR